MEDVNITVPGAKNPLSRLWSKFSSLDQFTRIMIIVFVAIAIATPIIVSSRLLLSQNAASLGPVVFVDTAGNAISQTTSPMVNVKLTSPWGVKLAQTTPRDNYLVRGNKAASESVAGASAYVIYDDKLENGWTDGSYKATINYNNTSPVSSGTKSISATINKGYGALEFNAPSNFSTTPYTHVQFLMHGTIPNQDLAIYSDNTRFQFLKNPVRLFNYGGYPSTTGWTLYTVPLADLNAVGKKIGDITIQNNTNNPMAPFYVDQVQFVNAAGGGSTPTPSISVVPTLYPTVLPTTPPTVSPSQPPSPTPSLAPYTTSIILAEDTGFTKNVQTINDINVNPITTSYTFSTTTLGTKTLYVKFVASNGLTQISTNTISLVAPVTPTPIPTASPTPSAVPTPTAPQTPTPPSSGRVYPWHTNIISTTFWVGEIFNASLSDGSQVCSTYDVDWAYHWSGINSGTVPSSAADCPGSIVGGCDGVGGASNCKTEKRTAANNYFPSSATPHENPFYLDLPFDDINDATAYKERCQVIPWANDAGYAGQCTNQNFSYMKNRWVKIVGPNGNTCYGQVEDAGPSHGSLYHDATYVFGTTDAKPVQGQFNDAGLDVSPALNGCLGYAELDGENDHVNWQFVDNADVPAGPWKTVVTTSGISE